VGSWCNGAFMSTNEPGSPVFELPTIRLQSIVLRYLRTHAVMAFTSRQQRFESKQIVAKAL